MEIIKITEQQGTSVVSGRDLHKFLKSKQNFTDWIQKRIEDYDFKEDVDYTKTSVTLSQGGRLKEYAITVDMAKELAMIEGNEQGRKARKYFIEVEKKFKEDLIQKVEPTKTYSQLELMKESINILIDQERRIEDLEKRVLKLTEESEATGTYEIVPQKSIDEKSLLTVTDIGSLIGTNAADLNKWLQQNNVQFKKNDVWHLKSLYKNKGYARYNTIKTVDKNGVQREHKHLKWTQKGKNLILRLWEKRNSTTSLKINVHTHVSVDNNLSPTHKGIKRCEHCGKEFQKITHNQKFCSTGCRFENKELGKSKDKESVKLCKYCGSKFTPKTSNQKFCDHECRLLWYSEFYTTPQTIIKKHESKNQLGQNRS